MQLAVRTDAGKQIGYGHLRRCTTLAEALRAQGAEVSFWIAGDHGVIDGPEPDATLARMAVEHPAAVIADSYRLDEGWFSAVRARAKVLVVDDLADRMLDADIVTNSAVGAGDLPYRTNARLLLGPQYALVRPAFREAAHATRGTIERVLVTLGGSDPHFRTRTIVAGLQAVLPAAAAIDVIVGPLHGEDAPLDELAARDRRIALHRGVTDLAPLVAMADVAVSGGGQTTFELAAAGVPSIAFSLAENQRHVLAGFERAGTLVHAGDAGAPDAAERLRSCLERLAPADVRQTMSQCGPRLVDGRGAERVAAALLEQIRE